MLMNTKYIIILIEAFLIYKRQLLYLQELSRMIFDTHRVCSRNYYEHQNIYVHHYNDVEHDDYQYCSVCKIASGRLILN